MRKKYSKPFFLVMISITSILCVFGLFNLSGCTDILGIDTNYTPFCDAKIQLDGPSSIFINTCDPLEITYNVIVDGKNITGPDNKVDWGFKWIIDGDFEIISAPSNGPLVIKPFVTNHQGGQITLMGQVDGDCKAEGDSGLRTLVYQEIPITLSTLSIDVHLCHDQMGNVLSGTAAVIDTEVPLSQDYIWEIIPAGAATISATTGPTISITNVTNDFELALQKVGKKCTTTPIVQQVKLADLPACN